MFIFGHIFPQQRAGNHLVILTGHDELEQKDPGFHMLSGFFSCFSLVFLRFFLPLYWLLSFFLWFSLFLSRFSIAFFLFLIFFVSFLVVMRCIINHKTDTQL